MADFEGTEGRTPDWYHQYMKDIVSDGNNSEVVDHRPTKTLAITAAILGVLSIVVTWVLLVGGVVLGVLAVIVGLAALTKARRGSAAGAGLSIVGIVTGAVGALSFVVFAFVGV